MCWLRPGSGADCAGAQTRGVVLCGNKNAVEAARKQRCRYEWAGACKCNVMCLYLKMSVSSVL